MEGKAKKPETTPPQVARVLKLVDETEESKEPQLKKKKMVKASDKARVPEALVEKSKGSFAAFLAAQRKTGPRLVIRLVAAYEALLIDEPIIVKPLAEVLLPSTGAVPFMAILVDSASLRPLGPNIEHLLEDFEMESEDSVARGQPNRGPNVSG
ncbi:hypothetical protein FH972_015260 [Carpinus fangiana]|uniref:Uncharacterized protein n=1 Tax=Carpinus fangiana TaxID=176857 RepID=A0A5N6RC94_9ROSI|nr:hypothetical protein FH972_015260 [Carpinus fangiana]